MPPLRILIASPRLLDRITIEKFLASNGYYGVVPLSSLDDVIKLSQVPCCPVDLMIIDDKINPDLSHDYVPNTVALGRPSVRLVVLYSSTHGTSSIDHIFYSHCKYYVADDPLSSYWLSTIVTMIQTFFTQRELVSSLQYSIITTGRSM